VKAPNAAVLKYLGYTVATNPFLEDISWCIVVSPERLMLSYFKRVTWAPATLVLGGRKDVVFYDFCRLPRLLSHVARQEVHRHQGVPLSTIWVRPHDPLCSLLCPWRSS
jgi:hypothetical protein